MVYDEHGGFYDHVEPPAAPDDDPAFRFFGPRVPALVVSPRLGTRVSHDVFDHASIVKTALVRFCRRDKRFIPDMGTRVSEARHLGVLLERGAAEPSPQEGELQQLASALAGWRGDALREELRVQDEAVQPDPASLTDFQKDYLAAREEVLSSLTPEERAKLVEAVGTSGQLRAYTG